MKLKVLQLMLVFLAAGLLVSSKETADNCKKECTLKCVPQKSSGAEKKNVKKKKQDAAYPYALAPGSYIFYY